MITRYTKYISVSQSVIYVYENEITSVVGFKYNTEVLLDSFNRAIT